MRSRKPTREEKERIAKQGLDWREWLVLPSSTKETLHIVHKESEKERHLPWKSKK